MNPIHPYWEAKNADINWQTSRDFYRPPYRCDHMNGEIFGVVSHFVYQKEVMGTTLNAVAASNILLISRGEFLELVRFFQTAPAQACLPAPVPDPRPRPTLWQRIKHLFM